jgi:hypothetical protein
MSVAALQEELIAARRRVVTDGYEMSLGEIASLYKSGELIIDPNYQRLFRWDESQKTRFIESLLLGIPVPPIFVFQRKSGIWELIDGLQRISTVLQLTGDLRGSDGAPYEALVLGGTNLLSGLAGMKWQANDENDLLGFDTSLQLEIKRSRMRVEILRKESDEDAKFELFQRLNTGGSKLSEQEVRNSVLVMINQEFFRWLNELTEVPAFRQTVQLTQAQLSQQQNVEMALRFISYRCYPYERGLDVNEYLDVAARQLANMTEAEKASERDTLSWTFSTLVGDVGDDVFKRWDGVRHVGKFLISAFDPIVYGVARNRHDIEQMPVEDRGTWMRGKIRAMWQDEFFRANSGQGVRGTTRLTNLLPFAAEYFAP